jgi:hypothetical protein
MNPRLMRLSNAALTEEFSAAWELWCGDELGEARINALYNEIRRRERAGLLSDEDWKIKSIWPTYRGPH